MALPPRQFKNLIAGKSPAAVYRVLRENHFLAKTDRATRQLIIAIVERAAKPRDPDPMPMPGPTSLDRLAGELLSFLNEKGADAYRSWPHDEQPTLSRPWWKWW